MERRWKESISKAIKIAGELCITPGASLLAEGDVKSGAIHAGVGLVAGLILGFPAIVLVGASSYLRSLHSTDRAEGPIGDKVREEVRAGLTLDEIKAGIAEDVEDRYHELLSAEGSSRESGAL
jgi:hypothetical protein